VKSNSTDKVPAEPKPVATATDSPTVADSESTAIVPPTTTAAPVPALPPEKDDWWTLPASPSPAPQTSPTAYPPPSYPTLEAEGEELPQSIPLPTIDATTPTTPDPTPHAFDLFARREPTSYQAFITQNETQVGQIRRLVRSRGGGAFRYLLILKH